MESKQPTFAETGDPGLLRDPSSNPHPEGTETHDWRIDQEIAPESPSADQQPLPEEQ